MADKGTIRLGDRRELPFTYTILNGNILQGQVSGIPSGSGFADSSITLLDATGEIIHADRIRFNLRNNGDTSDGEITADLK